jgi:phosphatidylserine decarboxylase
MEWQTIGLGLILGFIILLPLGWKWGIDTKTAVLAAACIGVVSGILVKGLELACNVEVLWKLFLEIFLILLISAALLLWRFFRDPERYPSSIENTIVSPADGKVIYIKRVENGQLLFSEKKNNRYYLNEFVKSDALPGSGVLIGISMNFLDVHVNRSPINGTIAVAKGINGVFLSLRKSDAIIKNARRLTIVDNGRIKVGVVQIASRLVRKIISYVNEGQEVLKGQRIGMIRFGSQVDLYIPYSDRMRVLVKKEEPVKAGLSVLATFSEESEEIE